MSDFFAPIRPSISSQARPDYQKILDMPGIDGLILRLEDNGIVVTNRMLVKDKKDSLGVVGSFFKQVGDEQLGNWVTVSLLLSVDEGTLMWTQFSYPLNANGEFVDSDDDCMYHEWCWRIGRLHELNRVELWETIKEEHAKSFGDMDLHHEIFSPSVCVGWDQSFRYTPERWISSLFSRYKAINLPSSSA